MKYTIFYVLFVLFQISPTHAQHPFIRIYNNEGQKFAKGHLQKTSDSGLIILKKGKESKEIKYSSIYKIRLRRSAGTTGLMVGGIPFLWGATSILDRYQENWEGLIGIVLMMEGLVIGPSASGLKALLNPKPLLVQGEYQKWMEAKMKLDKKLSKN